MKIGIFDPDVIAYAVKHEFGDRSFMRSAMDQNQQKIGDYIVSQFDMVLAKRVTQEQARKNIAQFIVGLIRDYIKKQGLVDTGRLLNSVEVRA